MAIYRINVWILPHVDSGRGGLGSSTLHIVKHGNQRQLNMKTPVRKSAAKIVLG